MMRLPLGHEPLGLELGAERLEAEWLRSFHSLAMTLRHSLSGVGKFFCSAVLTIQPRLSGISQSMNRSPLYPFFKKPQYFKF